jgi:hypothetical protein
VIGFGPQPVPTRFITRRPRVFPGLGAAGLIPGLAGLIALALLLPSGAPAGVFRPPHDRIFHGVSDTGHVRDYRTFRHRVRAHSALLEDFYHWDTPLTTGA